jgi:hypothetical protein
VVRRRVRRPELFRAIKYTQFRGHHDRPAARPIPQPGRDHRRLRRARGPDAAPLRRRLAQRARPHRDA